MPPHLPRAAALVLLAFLAACGGERVVADLPAPAYSINEVAYAFSERDATVVVFGNPTAASRPVLEQAITDAMRNHVMGVRTHFTTTPNATARPNYRVVLAFNTAQTMLNSALCSGAAIPTKPPGGPIVAQAAFCRDCGALTSATGWMDPVASPNDPNFRDLIGDLTFAIFPTRRTDDKGCSLADC